MAAGHEQQRKSKAPRKRRTKKEILEALRNPYALAINNFAKHGLENQIRKLSKEYCIAVLTLGFDVKATGKVAELRQCVMDEVAKGKCDNDFWRSLDARTNCDGVGGERGLDVDGGGASQDENGPGGDDSASPTPASPPER